MAKQAGIVFFEGTLGGINFYYRKGVPTARRAGGGFTAKAIKTSPTMARVRESNSEFAGCSGVNKHFKLAIVPFTAGYKDGTLHSRLMRLFLGIKDLDLTSERGKRKVSVGYANDMGKGLLKAFVICSARPKLFDCVYGFDWDNLVFYVSQFSVAAAKFPKGADVMEVVVGVVRFDFETYAYSHTMAEPILIGRDFDVTDFDFTVNGLPAGDGALIAVTRVAFYQEVNGERYVLPGGDGFGISLFN
ncbi:hypothetical protein [Winogradskyella forsetii]|uniref:hypothetical protein n=1 Tax=Winogradskyella forsetii TaxID=2686077 RepID=UPI0015B7DE50|nr:hypothetical protein [Winogradskyella forsetii]